MRTIIKHANRRLYDAEQKRVITLLELSDLVAGGEDLVVELKGTGEDITAVTLLQSVLERVKRSPDAGLPSGTAMLMELRAKTRGVPTDPLSTASWICRSRSRR